MCQSQNFNRFITVLKNPWFAASWFSLILGCYFYLDKPIAIFFHQLKGSELYDLANYTTDLGGGLYYLIGFAVFFLIAKFILHHPRMTKITTFLFLAVVIPGVVVDILKFILGRSRPALLFQQDIYGFYFFHWQNAFHSFPSGHATTVAGLAIACALLWSRGWYLFIAVAIWISVTRLIVTAHFLSDIMMGFYLGAIITIYFIRDMLESRLDE